MYISQVVTETDLLHRSHQLEQALENGQYIEYCAMKSANCTDPLQENIWNFLRVNFEKEPREHFIQLLGFDKTDLAKKVNLLTENWRFCAICVYLVIFFFFEKTNQVLWLITQVSEHVGLGQDAGVDAKVLAQKMAQLSPEVRSNILYMYSKLLNQTMLQLVK